MRKPTRKEGLTIAGGLLSCGALALVGGLLLGERQKTVDALATNQVLVAAAIQLTAEIAADSAGADALITSTSTIAPTSTLASTETLPPTFTPLPTDTPSATPGLQSFPVSAYEGGDNNIGINVDGAAQAVFARLTGHLTAGWEQLARYGSSAKRQDYAVDMLFSPVEDKLTYQRGPDFWEKHGGLGFQPDNYNGYDGVQTVLNASPKEFFKQGSNGIYRAIVEIQEEEDFEFALAAGIRAKFQILYPNLDFTQPEVLRAFDDLIRAGVNQAIGENGFQPKTRLPWPGADKIFGFQIGDFVDGEGKVCIGERPPSSDNLRSSQRPEKLPENKYIRGLENRTTGNDETSNQLDTRGSVMVTMAFDSNRGFLRTDILSLSSPPDPQRVETEPLDSENIEERAEIGRWVPCGPGAPAVPTSEIAVTWTPTGPVFQITPAETPKPGDTPRPSGTPQPPGTPEIPNSTPQNPEPTLEPGPTDAGTPAAPPPIEDTPAPEVIATPPQNPTPDSNQTPLAP